MVMPEKAASVPVPLRTTPFRSSLIEYAVDSFIATHDSCLFSSTRLPLLSRTSM